MGEHEAGAREHSLAMAAAVRGVLDMKYPAAAGTFRTVAAHQAHHLDLEFYDRFCKPGADVEAYQGRRERWYPAPVGGNS